MDKEQNHIDQIKTAFQEKTAALPALTPEQEKQILHEIIQERIAPQPQQSSGTNDSGDSDAQRQTRGAAPMPPVPPPVAVPQEIQNTVKSLVTMAVRDDLYKATKLAYQTKNPYLIDQYHDTLVNEFYELIKLQERS